MQETLSLSATDTLRQALQAKNLRYVGTRGDTKAPVCIVGEAPGADEDRAGFPFVGYSGQLLDQMIREAGFDGKDIWFTNPYKSRPPDNDIKRIGELNIPLSLFHDQFFEELRDNRPRIIVACGKSPANLLCPETKPKSYKGKEDEKEGFGSWRGSLLISPFLNWDHYVIPMYHPAYVLRNYSEREICVFILSRAHEEFTYFKNKSCLQPLPTRDLIVNPDFQTAYTYLNSCTLSREPVSVDIELLKRRVPYTVSFARTPTSAVSISFWNYETNQCVALWRKMDEIFSRKKMIMQNGTSFDCHWLRSMGFNVNLSNVEDTLIMHHVLWPGLRHKLEFLCMMYSREPFYKWEGRGWSQKDGLDKLMLYNCKDTVVTYEAYLGMKKEIQERL